MDEKVVKRAMLHAALALWAVSEDETKDYLVGIIALSRAALSEVTETGSEYEALLAEAATWSEVALDVVNNEMETRH